MLAAEKHREKAFYCCVSTKCHATVLYFTSYCHFIFQHCSSLADLGVLSTVLTLQQRFCHKMCISFLICEHIALVLSLLQWVNMSGHGCLCSDDAATLSRINRAH